MPRKKTNNYVEDSLVNTLTGLGTSRDKSTFNEWTIDAYNHGLLTALYSSNWLAKRIVTVPADEAVKKWREITTPSMTQDQIDAFNSFERKLKVRKVNKTALYWSRLLRRVPPGKPAASKG